MAKWGELSAEGLRLNRISSFRTDTGVVSFADTTVRLFTGVFGQGSDGYALWVSEWDSFEAKWKELSASGLRLVDLAAYVEGGRPMFAGVFRAGNDPYALWVAPWTSFEAKWKELTAAGLRLVSLDSYHDGSQRIFTGVYRAGQAGHALWVGDTWEAFAAKVDEFRASGLHLVDVCSYSDSGQRFGGVFAAGTSNVRRMPQRSRLVRQPWPELVQTWQQLSSTTQGLMPQRLTSLDTFVSGSDS